MKKSFFTFLMILNFQLLQALPVGNPAEASLLTEGVVWNNCDSCSWLDCLSVRAGFYGDYVFNRNLEVDGGSFERIMNTTLTTNAGYLALNICDCFDIFATLGATQIGWLTDLAPFTVAPNQEHFIFVVQGATHFSWSIGGRGTLWRSGCAALGVEGQYFSTNPLIARFSRNNAEALYTNQFSMHYQEWQLGLGVTYRVYLFAPYVALKYSRSTLTFNNHDFLGTTGVFTVERLRDLRNRNSWGWAIGSSLIECNRVSLAVEGRFADEKALYINGQIRF